MSFDGNSFDVDSFSTNAFDITEVTESFARASFDTDSFSVDSFLFDSPSPTPSGGGISQAVGMPMGTFRERNRRDDEDIEILMILTEFLGK